MIKAAKAEIRMDLKETKGPLNNRLKRVKVVVPRALRAAEARVIAEMVIEARPRYAGGRVRRLQIY